MINYSYKTVGEIEEIANNYRNQRMNEYDILLGSTAKTFAEEFIEFVNSRKCVGTWFANFKGKFFFSTDNDLTVDNIYKGITGKTIAEAEEEAKKWR